MRRGTFQFSAAQVLLRKQTFMNRRNSHRVGRPGMRSSTVGTSSLRRRTDSKISDRSPGRRTRQAAKTGGNPSFSSTGGRSSTPERATPRRPSPPRRAGPTVRTGRLMRGGCRARPSPPRQAPSPAPVIRPPSADRRAVPSPPAPAVRPSSAERRATARGKRPAEPPTAIQDVAGPSGTAGQEESAPPTASGPDVAGPSGTAGQEEAGPSSTVGPTAAIPGIARRLIWVPTWYSSPRPINRSTPPGGTTPVERRGTPSDTFLDWRATSTAAPTVPPDEPGRRVRPRTDVEAAGGPSPGSRLLYRFQRTWLHRWASLTRPSGA